MRKYKSGQVALVILLIMVTVLTVGLSLISHSITDISVSKDEEEAIRVFSAAEAGIETALKDIESMPSNTVITVEGIETEIDVASIGGATGVTADLARGEFININVNGFNGTVDIEWTEEAAAGNNAALEVIIFSNDNSVARGAYSQGGTCANGFSALGSNLIDNLPVGVNQVLLRIKALCNNTTVTVTPASGSLPIQGHQINSQASSALTPETEVKTSTIEVTRTLPALPPIFDYVLFAQGEIE